MPEKMTTCLAITGKDREAFLQGQLTQDIRRLAGARAQLAAWCNPKGRVTAVLILVAQAERILAFLPGWQAESFRNAILRYRLRADVQIEQEPALDIRAVRGTGSDVRGAIATLPLPGSPHPHVLVMAEHATATGPAFLGADERELVEIRAGLPALAPATVESFTPHMMNLDLLGAVSFSKGCYTGQEVVARTENLGRPSRRMLAFEADRVSPPAAGDRLLDDNGAAAATVLRAVSAGPAVELLAVVSLKALAGGLFLADGKPLRPRPLPYAVPELDASRD